MIYVHDLTDERRPVISAELPWKRPKAKKPVKPRRKADGERRYEMVTQAEIDFCLQCPYEDCRDCMNGLRTWGKANIASVRSGGGIVTETRHRRSRES